MEKSTIRIILTVIFICWMIYVVLIAKKTNKKYYKNENKINQEEWLKIVRKEHLLKVFLGLFVVLIVFLFLIIVNAFLE